MNYLVDTNVLAELRKADRCDAGVARWAEAAGARALYTSVLALGEIRKGVERLRGRDPRQAAALERWLEQVRTVFGDRVLPVDEAVAEEWGRMGAKRSVATVDGLLAATAKVHGLTLATRNTADVRDLGVRVVNPFAGRR